MEKLVRGRIDKYVRPVLLIVDSNHTLVDREVIPAHPAVWL